MSETQFPPAGWVDRHEAGRILGVSAAAVRQWVVDGTLPAGRPAVRPNGRPAVLYAVGDLERVRDARAALGASGGLPPGHVGEDEAARLLGIGVPGFLKWIREGRLHYAGALVGLPGGGKRRAYAVDQLHAAHAAMLADHAARTAVPEGHVNAAGAAAFFGMRRKSLQTWVTNGVLTCGVWATGPSGRQIHVYPVAELERIRAEMAARRVLPEGMVDIEGACAMFGVSESSWHIWDNQGKLPEGSWWADGTRARRCVYDVVDLRKAMKRLRGTSEVWREGGRDGRYHVPEGRVTIADAAEMLGVTKPTVTRWDREGIIESGQTHRTRGGWGDGTRVRTYARDEVERLVAEHGKYAPPYPDPQRPGVVRVPMWRRGIERPEAIIDEVDLPIVAGRRWYLSRFDAGDKIGHVGTSSVAGDTVLHHAILGAARAEPGMCVGHRNGDPLDCRRANLVWRTLSERNAAMGKVKLIRGQPPSSRFKGVSWHRKDEVWRVRIKFHGVQRGLGSFRDEIAAAERYDDAARELFGEHARLNFPDGIDARLAAEAASGETTLAKAA